MSPIGRSMPQTKTFCSPPTSRTPGSPTSTPPLMRFRATAPPTAAGSGASIFLSFRAGGPWSVIPTRERSETGGIPTPFQQEFLRVLCVNPFVGIRIKARGSAIVLPTTQPVTSKHARRNRDSSPHFDSRAPRQSNQLQRLAAGSGHAHAHEQSGRGGG